MGDKATGRNEKNNKDKGDATSCYVKIPTAERVPPAVRRFIHLGCKFDPYRAQKYHARGICSVEPLQFNYRKAYSLGIFSEFMTESFNVNKEVKDDLAKYEKVPEDGWPSEEMVQVVKKLLKDDGGACRPAAIFVLAACCRSQGRARSAAYSYVKILDNADDLLLFVKYAMDLTPERKGWGAGLRRAVKSWYLDRCGELELAEQITRYKQRHCWSHKDVLKQIHAKPKNKVQEMVIAYAMFGMGKAQELLDSIPKEDSKRKEAEDVMAYLDGANKLRKIQLPKGSEVNCPQVRDAVKLIKTHKFHLEHCDDTMHMVPAIWEALLEHMLLWELLSYLPKLRFHRIIKPGEEITKVVLACLKRANDSLTKHSSEKIHPPISPALVLISLQTYRRRNSEDIPSKLWVSTKDGVVTLRNPTTVRHVATQSGGNPVASAHNQNKTACASSKSEDPTKGITSALCVLHMDKGKKAKELPKPNPKILENLNKILVASIKAMHPTGKRFIFGAGNIQDKNGCLINQYVMTHEAAALIFMCLEAAEAEGTVSGYCIPAEGPPCRRLRSTGYSIINCAREIMQGIGTNPIKVESWINWLRQEKLRADVLVLMADAVLCENDSGNKLLEAMKKYRKDLKLPKAKLVLVALNSRDVPLIHTQIADDGILMVVGFDSHLPFMIQRFARDEF